MELFRLFKSLQLTMGELRTELRELAVERRTQITAGALLDQRVGMLEGNDKDQEGRLRLVEQDLAGRKESAEKSRRSNMWVATGIAALGLSLNLVFDLVK
ncbi:hypothetical protein [Nonomuraea dietziae]|uniref:hypothetical protein n=1 Tax=Nonomuraea dietziae TaxID=65515 RepID=UPI0033FF4E8C